MTKSETIEEQKPADDATTITPAVLDDFWQRAMLGLLAEGVDWREAALSMTRIGALNIAKSWNAKAAAISLAGASAYFHQVDADLQGEAGEARKH